MATPSLTIGIEEEYQTIDPETRDLRSHIGTEMIEKGKTVLDEARQAGDAPVGDRDRHRRLPQHPGGQGPKSA